MDQELKNYRLLQTLVLISFVIILIFSLKLQVFEGKYYYRLSEENRIKKKYIIAPRGNIYDRYGREIANTRPAFYVSIIPALTNQQTIEKLAQILGMSSATIMKKLKIEKNPYVAIKIARDVSFREVSIIEEKISELPGIEVGVEPVRNYPYGELLCHALGYVSEITDMELKQLKDYKIGDYIGRTGIEQQYEKELAGKDGVDYIEVDVLGKEVGKVAEYRPIPPVPGKDLYTTLDLELCDSTAKFLKDYQKASAIALNPQDGAIYVLYSKPGYDPNRFVHGLTEKEWEELINSRDAPMYNRAVMSCYPIGSTIKPFLALAALHKGFIQPTKRFEPCHGGLKLGNRVFGCWKIHGSLDLIDAIVYSCDVYFYQLGRLLGIDNIAEILYEVEFGKPTGIDIPQEKTGLIPDRDYLNKKYGRYWTEGHIFNLSIGQGDILATPLQLARAFTVFANQENGVVVPHLNKNLDIRIKKINKSDEALKIIRNALADVVERGTATLARVHGYQVSGKTGTAENPHGEDHSIFIGYAPDEEPQILVCVFVENAGHGGSIAAPIAGRIIQTYYEIEKRYTRETK
ncbi:MAG: penicillin-binding protein 2 [candidate division WOR-3 bacterium]|nr:penicillin-binding protein 2 [candidate division WOR-3 bacterium]